MKTTVIFCWFEGEVIALFPEIPSNANPYYCQSYSHFGQHGAADPIMIVRKGRLAIAEEYAELKAELENIGYSLVIRTRFTQRHYQKRLDALIKK